MCFIALVSASPIAQVYPAAYAPYGYGHAPVLHAAPVVAHAPIVAKHVVHHEPIDPNPQVDGENTKKYLINGEIAKASKFVKTTEFWISHHQLDIIILN